MSTRWQPYSGERYWTVSAEGYAYPTQWYDDGFDNNVHAFGNCFKTREQAEVVLEKIKKVLLEAANDN